MLLSPEPAKDVRLYALFPFFRQRYETNFAQSIKPLAQERQRMIRPMLLAGTLTASACGGDLLYVTPVLGHGLLPVGSIRRYCGACAPLHAVAIALSVIPALLPHSSSPRSRMLPCQ